MSSLSLILTPHGLLHLAQAGEGVAVETTQGARITNAFAHNSGHGLLQGKRG